MKEHVLVYLQSFNYDTSDFIPCEICRNKATDIHHINARGMGGSKEKNNIENLMAICRKCHTDYGDIKEFKDYLNKIHSLHLRKSNISNKTE